jgi:hypothetical protein
MKKTIGKHEFTDVMTLRGFSYNGAVTLFNYLEEVENEMGEQIEFDPHALTFEWYEYKTLEEIARDFGEEYGDLDYLSQETIAIKFDNGILVLNF